MPTANDLPEVLETTEPERLATGFIFTEGPLWHPDGNCGAIPPSRRSLILAVNSPKPKSARSFNDNRAYDREGAGAAGSIAAMASCRPHADSRCATAGLGLDEGTD